MTSLAVFIALTAVFGIERIALADAQSAVEKSVHWRTGTASLDQSQGTFAVPPHGRLATGSDARKLDEAINGREWSDDEAVLFSGPLALHLRYRDLGYVATSETLPADDESAILKAVADSLNAADPRQKKLGALFYRLDGWVQKPTFDAQRRSERFIVALRSKRGRFVVGQAFRLGRHGYEEFVLLGPASNPAAERAAFAGFIADFNFDRRFRLGDYVSADKLTGYVVTAMVGPAIGTAVAKMGPLAAIVLLLERFAGVTIVIGATIIIAGGAALSTRFKKSFGNRT